MKIKYRIALLFSSLTAGIILLLGIFVFVLATEFTYADYYKRLEIRAVVAAKAYFSDNDAHTKAFRELRTKHLGRLPEEKDFFVKIKGDRPVNLQKELLQLPESFFQTVLKEEQATARDGNGLYSGILYIHQDVKYIVIVSARNTYGLNQLATLRNILIIGGGLSVLLVMVVSLVFAQQILKPIRNIIIKAKSVSAYNLHERLHSNDKDEIDELANTINNMLDRLATAFESQNNFVSNASHELRTPLTTIIGEADWALSKPRQQEDYRQVLHIISEQAERLKQLSTSLLRLAQSGFDGKKQDWIHIRPEELLWSVKTTVNEIRPDNKVVYNLKAITDAQKDILIFGNDALLNLALTNIVVNACKYADNNTTVNVTLHINGNNIVISVQDHGIGISAKDLPHVLDPFYRGSNAASYEGFGVGLSLSANIVRLHDGTIDIASVIGKGTTVTILLPYYS